MDAPHLNLYVIHSKSLTFRKDNIDRLVAKLEGAFTVRVELVTAHEPADIDRDTLMNVVASSAPADVPDGSPLKGLAQTLHIRQVSNLMKHAAALDIIAGKAEASGEAHLIIEDDVAYPENVAAQLAAVLKDARLADDCDVLFTGLPATKAWEQGQPMERITVFDQFAVLPCVDSYVVTPAAAARLAAALRPFYYPTHLQLTYCLNAKGCADIRARYSVPNVFADGSKLGTFTSMLNTNNKLFLNSEYNDMLAIARNPQVTDAMYGEAQAILERARGIKDHPDMAYLAAVIELKRGDHQKAHAMMRAIYEVYKSNGVILNHESEFLRVFIDSHKHVQEN